ADGRELRSVRLGTSRRRHPARPRRVGPHPGGGAGEGCPTRGATVPDRLRGALGTGSRLRATMVAMTLSEHYSATLIDHFERPRNAGPMPDAHAQGYVVNPVCGDSMR